MLNAHLRCQSTLDPFLVAEIFTNPYDLQIRGYFRDGAFDIFVTRGPEGNFRELLRAERVAETREGLVEAVAGFLECVRQKGLTMLNTYPRLPLPFEIRAVNASARPCLNAMLIVKAVESIASHGVALTNRYVFLLSNQEQPPSPAA